MSTHAPADPQPSDPTRIEVVVAAPVDTVWKALRVRDTLRNWHGWDCDELDAEIDMIYFTDVVEDTARHTLVIHGGDEFTVDEIEAGSRVRLTRVPYGSNPEWDPYYEGITEGWITFLNQLTFTLERQPSIQRRTLFLSGQDPTTSPVDAVGLTDVARQEVGTRYAATLAGVGGEGTVWFRTDHQLGLTVEGWSAGGQEGLLVLTRNPSSDGASAGGATAILSTYGLTSGDFDALAGPWNGWWDARFPSPVDEPSAAS